jgi:undecaprenyl-diphosphatase
MFEHIVLGAIQGVTEWVPVSSKACVIAARVHLFGSMESLNGLINYALFLHLGTFLAAVVYFREDVIKLLKACVAPKAAEQETRNILVFLVMTTVLTGLGQVLIDKMDILAHSVPRAKVAVTCLIAGLLIVAGFLQLKSRNDGKRTPKDLTILDGVILGLTQAVATLPGLSRAGTTMAALSFRGFDKEHMLKLSFLMSLPVIFVGNIIKNHKMLFAARVEWVGVVVAFGVGILTIGALMALARRINFGAFLIFIGSVLALAVIAGALD